MNPLESVDQFVLPPAVNGRLQELARLQSQGKLTATERQELELLMQTKQTLDELRTKAMKLLGSGTAIGPLQQTTRNGLPVVQVPAGTPAIDPDAVRRFLQEQAF